ncbi:MAG: hypothetical protein AAF226_10545 [Verrucomicrobiota bacterium]
MTINLKRDLESRIQKFPQIMDRLPSLLEQQVALEEWRERRFSDEARSIVDQVFNDSRDKSHTTSQDFSRLEAAFAELSGYLEANHGEK